LRRDGCGQWIMLLPFHALLLRLLQEWNISWIPLRAKTVGIVVNGACSKYRNVPLKRFCVWKKYDHVDTWSEVWV
jgi:hypothetical protein